MSNKPIKRFSQGLLNVAIWKNIGTNRYGGESVFHTVSISRGYKDKNGEFKSSNSLRPEDLPVVRELIAQAEKFLNEPEPELEDEMLEEVI